MTVKELKELLKLSNDNDEVTICYTVDEDYILWEKVSNAWRISGGQIVLMGKDKL